MPKTGPYTLGDASDDLQGFARYLASFFRQPASPRPANASPAAPVAPVDRYAPDMHRPLLERLAGEYQIPTALADSWVMKESSWNPHSRGRSGEYGLTQIMPYLVKRYGIQQTPLDPEANLRAGLSHLSGLLKEYKGDVPRALAAYNVGQRGEREGRPRGKAYAEAILGLQKKKYGQ
jgi:soluble lytic murein transglycosylase-like protein